MNKTPLRKNRTWQEIGMCKLSKEVKIVQSDVSWVREWVVVQVRENCRSCGTTAQAHVVCKLTVASCCCSKTNPGRRSCLFHLKKHLIGMEVCDLSLSKSKTKQKTVPHCVLSVRPATAISFSRRYLERSCLCVFRNKITLQSFYAVQNYSHS